MDDKEHYFTESPSTPLKFFTISESLRKHLFIFKTTSGIFGFKKIDLGTKVLIENIVIPQNASTILDLGCGYGVIGIILGYELPKSTIYMNDINKRAIWCAKENVKINLPNQSNRIKIIRSSYFKSFQNSGLQFDAIYTNPPLRRGKKEFIEICQEVPKYLSPGGFFLFVIKHKMGAASILSTLKTLFPNENIEVIRKKSGYWVFQCFYKK